MRRIVLAVMLSLSIAGCASMNKTDVKWTKEGVEVHSKKGTLIKFKDGEKEVTVDNKSSNIIKDFVTWKLMQEDNSE